jgi:hypothetical protein
MAEIVLDKPTFLVMVHPSCVFRRTTQMPVHAPESSMDPPPFSVPGPASSAARNSRLMVSSVQGDEFNCCASCLRHRWCLL